MHGRLIICCLAAGVALAPVSSFAQTASLGVGVGTQGVNVEMGYQFSDPFGLRLSGNYFRYGHDIDVDTNTYRGSARLLSLGLLGDFFMFSSDFRLTGGVYYNQNAARFHSTPTNNVTLGGSSYTPAEIGTLTGSVTYRDFAPYLGLGYTSNHNTRGWGFTSDLGVMFQGGPRVALASNGTGNTLPGYAASVEQERQNIRNKIDWTEFYPVARIGLVYRF